MIYKIKKNKKKKIEKKIKKIFIFYIFPILLFFLSSYFIFNSNYFKFKEIKIIFSDKINKEILKKEVWEILNDEKVLYSKNNFLFYPKKEIKDKIKEKYDFVDEIEIKKEKIFSKNMLIKIKDKNISYIWCFINNKNNCYFAEENGKIFSKYNDKWITKTKEEFIIFFGNNKNNRIIDEKKFTKIKTLIEEIKDKNNLEIKNIYIKNDKEVWLKTNKTILIIFLDQEINKITDTINKISKKEELKINKKNKDFFYDIKYINLTFDKKIFYCNQKICRENYDF